MAFKRITKNGKTYWKEIPVQNPDIQLSGIGYIDRRSDAWGADDLWVKWRKKVNQSD